MPMQLLLPQSYMTGAVLCAPELLISTMQWTATERVLLNHL